MIGASPSGKAPGFDLGIRWFESSRPCHSIHLYIAVLGASPSGKAPGFDLGIRWFESSRPCHLNQWFK
jgi:hypothetical protein